MPNSIHKDFILSPIVDLLKDVISACSGVGKGIETFPLYDYIMQSAFLKMTGFQEQKMKCIYWEMATFDFEFRYNFTKTPLGECSSYDDKQKAYQELVKQICKNGLKFSEIDLRKNEILSTTTLEISEIFKDTNLQNWAQNDFFSFQEQVKLVKPSHFANQNTVLFSNRELKTIYKTFLYRHRNKIAHNTSSYQQNLPTLKTLLNTEYKYHNYFTYFFTLIIIDKIFVELYKNYLKQINEHVF